MRISSVAVATSILLMELCSQAWAGGQIMKLKLTYNNRVKLPIITLNNESEIDFFFDPGSKNVSVYYPDGGQMKFVGDKRRGHGYYFGPVNLRFATRPGAIDMYGSYRSHLTHTHIVSDGKSSCSASISSRLKPGFDAYEYDEPGYGPVKVLETEQTNVRCELTLVDSI